jgi:anti-anti-sigma regulatory factor
MNSNTFARKKYLNSTWRNTEVTNFLSHTKNKSSLIVDVDLLRATANEADILKDYLEGLPLKENKSVVINLDKCTFVDSTFLSAIIRFNKRNAQLKNSVKLVISDVRQFSIFKITKIDTIFNIYSTLEEAIA